MRSLPKRAPRLRLPAEVRAQVPGRPLAFAEHTEGWLVGTVADLVDVAGAAGATVTVLPWHEIHSASWDSDEERLVVLTLGRFGSSRQRLAFAVREPVLLLQLIRERVQASVLMSRQVTVSGARGFRVVGRRDSTGGLHWFCDFDRGIDPEDPGVRQFVDSALEAARAEVGG